VPRSSSGRTEDARQLWSGGAATAAIAALIALAGILVCRWLFGSGVERQVDMAEVNGRGAPDTFRCDRREGPACRMAPLEQRAYLVLMPPTARSMYAATYVKDIDTSRAFYELLGFRELRAGRAATSAWSALQHHTLFVLLTSTRPPLEIPPLPLLFYFFYDDVEAVVGALAAAGVRITRTGHPPHALGGEVKVLDPDGNTILLGTREPSAAQPVLAEDESSIRFSLLREAAALAARAARPIARAGCVT